MDIGQLRLDIRDLLSSVDTFRVFPTIPDSIVGPTAVVFPETVTYHATFDGGNDAVVVVQFLTPAVMSQSMQTMLDSWLGLGTGQSAVDAIETDGRLVAQPMRNYGVLILGDGSSRYYTAEVPFSVFLDD